jgi:hypothetical protein
MTHILKANGSPVETHRGTGLTTAIRLPPSDDLAHGQVVIVAARWILVGSGILLALWSPGSLAELRLQIAVLLVLAAGNFYLHTRVLMGQPVSTGVA